jgi:anthranilate synthase component II
LQLLLLDNYDSFTYNLLHLLEQFDGFEITVRRNDEITIEQASAFDRIVFSPGPGLPENSGIMQELIKAFMNEKKMLGICLGMQAMAQVTGGKLSNMKEVSHGQAVETLITDPNDCLFKGLPAQFKTGRYHSWMVSENDLPDTWKITARSLNGEIMALTHENQLLRGVQFHPESILTEYGKEMIYNWLHHC